MTSTTIEALKEKLAAIEHERWADWQKWVHKVLRETHDPSPEYGDILERWDRQIETPYSELSDKEKDSDREQVDRYWPLIEAYVEAEKLRDRIKLLDYLRQDAGYGEYTATEYRDAIELRIQFLQQQLDSLEEGE